MKPKILVVCLLVLLLSSCNLPSTTTPAPTLETPLVFVTSTPGAGGVITQDNVSFTVPLAVAANAQFEKVAANMDTGTSPWWEIAPAHLKFTLTGYQLQDKFLEPTITVYPAEEYAKLDTPAAQQIEKLRSTGPAPSLYSNEVRVVTPGQIPEAPANLRATRITKNSVSLAWDDKSNNETGFYVERSLNGTTWARDATLPANTNTYTNTGLKSKTPYYYRVQAFNADGVTAYTNIVQI